VGAVRERKRERERDRERGRERRARERKPSRVYSHIFFFRTVTVVLESEEGGSVELLLTYQVFGASWRPTYDIRVNTDEENKEMQV